MRESEGLVRVWGSERVQSGYEGIRGFSQGVMESEDPVRDLRESQGLVRV